jgi:hypothetical protein
MANLDTRSKRASSVNFEKSYAASMVLPDGTIGALDRQHSAWSYSGVLASFPGGVTLMAMERAMFRRVFGRVFGRIN